MFTPLCKRFLFASVLLWALLPVVAADEPVRFNKGMRLTAVDGTLALGESVVVTIDGLGDWAHAGGRPELLVPVMNGRFLDGLYPDAVDHLQGHLMYHLEVLPTNRDAWADLLRDPVFSRPVTFSVGLEREAALPTVYSANNKIPLVIIHPPWGWMSLVIVVGIGALLIWLSRHTNLIREPATIPGDHSLRKYSLALTQMAFWFYLVLSSYLVLWLITGDLNTINESLLGLMGISAGTALGGSLFGRGQKPESGQVEPVATAASTPNTDSKAPDAKSDGAANEAAAPSPDGSVQPSFVEPAVPPSMPLSHVSRGFITDLLCDEKDHSFHRFQIVAITVVLGVIFVSNVYSNLQMPAFSPSMLALMGISSGTYLGFKAASQ